VSWAISVPIFLSMGSFASADVVWKTYKNTSGADADDFRLTASKGSIADARVYQPAGPGKEKTAPISKIPNPDPFPTMSVDLDFSMPVGDGGKAAVKIGFPKGMPVTLDPAKTGFTKKGVLVSSDSLTLAPEIMNLGGNKFEVVLTNVNGSFVNASSVTIMYDDPGNPNLLDTWTPGGSMLSITQPTNPLAPGATVDYFFSAIPYLTVSVSDVVALTSAPDDTFFDLAATSGVPEASTWSMMLLGFGGLGATIRRGRAVRRWLT
jgi:hypothetical protein